MRLNFRQGIVSAQDTFLHYTTGGDVSVLADNRPLTVTIADKSSNYIHSEDDTVLAAWSGPFVGGVDYWLYMEFDPVTFARSFGHTTLEPKSQPTPPANPVAGQMWYNTDTNEHFVNLGVAWSRVYRVLTARLNSTVFHSMSINGPSDFTGTQIGNTTSVRAGRILYTEFGKTLKRDDKTLFTTEDQFFTNQSQVIGVRLEANVTRAKSAEPAIAQYQVVTLLDGGEMRTAQYSDTENGILAVLGEDVLLGETGNVIVQGTVINPAWDFSTSATGTKLWVNNGELTTVDPYAVDTAANPLPMVPVARVMSRDTVIFEQGLGGVGPPGPPDVHGHNNNGSFALVFKDIQPDATTIYKVTFNQEFLFAASPIAHKVDLEVAPSATATWNVLKNGVVVGTITIDSGVTTGNVIFSSDTTFADGDVFKLDTVAVNGATDLSINFLVNKTIT